MQLDVDSVDAGRPSDAVDPLVFLPLGAQRGHVDSLGCDKEKSEK